MTQPDTNDPSITSKAVLAMQTAWERITALLGGTDAMREAGAKYLPKNPGESAEAYQKRLSVAVLYPGFKRTAENLASRPFSEPMILGDDMPAAIRGTPDDKGNYSGGWIENIDLQGRNLQAFSLEAFRSALQLGLMHILVDYPTVSEEVKTVADEKAVGARPYFVMVDPRRVRGWRSKTVAGVEVLTMLRFSETVTVDDGEFGEKQIEQIRVVEPTRTRLFRKAPDDATKWLQFSETPNTLGKIALATIYTGRTGFMTAEPPLDALAHMNVEHWQSSSEQQNLLHVARVPILFGKGFGDKALTIGANSAVTSDDTNADLTYVEHTGAAIGAGRQSILDLELRMAAAGAELLVSRPGTKTATEASIDSAQATSTLGAMVEDLEDSLGVALGFMAEWGGLGESGGTVALEGDTDALDPLDVQSLVQAVDSGFISPETAFETMRRLGMIDDELTWDDEKKRLAEAAQQKLANAMAMAAAMPPKPGQVNAPAPAPSPPAA